MDSDQAVNLVKAFALLCTRMIVPSPVPWHCSGPDVMMPKKSHWQCYNKVSSGRQGHGQPWQCHGLPWLFGGTAAAVLCYALALPWQYHGNIITVPWQQHGSAHCRVMSLSWHRQGTAMTLSWPCPCKYGMAAGVHP